MYEPRVTSEIRHVRREAKEPQLFGRLLRVLEEQRGHTLAMDVENAKIALSDRQPGRCLASWVEPGLGVAISRADLVSHTKELAARIGGADQGLPRSRRGLPREDIDAVFLTGGSVQLAHVRRAIVQGVRPRRSSKATRSGRSAKASRSKPPGGSDPGPDQSRR